ncbi:hypothetical protein WH47_01787 [Habropoda laboriosa]|uniref:Uncharacterized protein n=1 Tax=Habropoda laboriosa TaxID=597456 RepID=A0A0L7RJY6_9HYME|nr:hypothetical protein WH47_01787 [Habropoda laboriosa]
MLHDIDSLMDFEESKTFPNFFCSTANDSIEIDNNIEISQLLEVDPLAITDCDEDNTIVEDQINENKRTKRVKVVSKPKKLSGNIKNKTKGTKITIEKTADVDYDHIKEILGTLDIDLDIKKEEEVRKEVIEEEERKEKLYSLKVNIIHKVPPQHDIEGVLGTKPLTKTQRKLFLNYGPLKDGVFTPNEDKIIKENWKTFCEVHDWNPKYVQPFLCMTINGQFYIKSLEQRKKFAQFLANGIPWRSLYSVYHRFKNLHRKYEKSFHRYTPAEDQTILSYMKKGRKKKKHTKYADLSKILGRTSHSIWMRYQLLQKMQKDGKKESMYDVTWTLSLIGTFIKNLMNITLCNNVKDLKDAIIPKPVWLKLEEKLGIGYNLLKLFWWNQLHAQLFSTEPIYLNDIKIKLIEYVYGKGISNTREIVWQDVAKYFDGITSIFLCKVFYYLVHKAAVKISTTDFPAIVEYLYNREIRYIKNEVIDRFLPRLSYDNEKVDFVDEGNEIQ